MTVTQIVERRLSVLSRLLSPRSQFLQPCYTYSSKANDTEDKKSISIGDVTKKIKIPRHPELVPVKYLPGADDAIPFETLKHLKWIMQKDLLGQDVFLIGRPGPLRRSVVMQYLQLTQRELEYVALSRDTTESDLKQRREIINGTAHYIDQSAVRAASEGRILVLEGIEKAERNVLPVLNNLLENREMHLEDGRLLIPAERYDKLLNQYGQEELDKWQLVRVSEDFRVIALGLPVPYYSGNPLDPPLRSRFQARDIRFIPFAEQLKILQSIGTNISKESISQILSFAHCLVTDESKSLNLNDFPVENLPVLIEMLNNAPNVPLQDAVKRLYPYKAFLAKDSITSVEDTLQTFELLNNQSLLSKITNHEGQIEVTIGKAKHQIPMPVGNHFNAASNSTTKYVPTAYHDSLLAELLLSHSVHDFCIIGPRGCGKTILVEKLGQILGYEVEPIMLYQDMTARDLLQQRTTLSNGDTVWKYSPLVEAALSGKMAVLDGIHRMHKGTLAVLHRLIHDRELQLYDGTRLLGSDRYEEAKIQANCKTDEEMAAKKILKIKDNFRLVGLAEPPSLGGSAKGQWLTTEMLSMFLFHEMRSLSRSEEELVLRSLTGVEPNNEVISNVLDLAYKLRSSEDNSLATIANSLTTRQLVRIARRQTKFPTDDIYEYVQKACLGRFLPPLARESLENMLEQMAITKSTEAKPTRVMRHLTDTELTIGNTTVPVSTSANKTKIPETLFYDTDQNLMTMEEMLRDYVMGEHLLLIGNQGVGKNKLVDRMLNMLNRSREYIQLHRDTTVQSLTLQPTVDSGVIKMLDSPLVKAVKSGHVLVVDEADKAPTHVTCILKTLVEAGEMILSDGRRIVPPNSLSFKEGDVQMHPDFRMIVLANRPGFPFLGNDFFAALGDLFSCHAIDNPCIDSEMTMLQQYAPDVPNRTLYKLVKVFSELRSRADEGSIQYPYSTREVVNIVKHLQRFPNEALGQVVRNVFDFDAYDSEVQKTLEEILQKNGIPINVSQKNIALAREFTLPQYRLAGTWEILRSHKKRMIKLPVDVSPVNFGDPQQVSVYNQPLDRVEARGLGFSEMQSYWALPFHDFAIAGDVCTIKDKHDRQLYDQIIVATVNPVWIYAMTPLSDKTQRLTLNHFFDQTAKGGGGSWRTRTLPRIKLAPLGGRFSSVVAVHDEVSDKVLLVEPDSGSIISLQIDEHTDVFAPLRDMVQRVGSAQNKPSSHFRLVTDFAQDNKLLFYTPGSNRVQMIDLSLDAPMSYKLELPILIESLHPLNEHQYLVSARDISDSSMTGEENSEPVSRLYLLRRESADEPMPSTLNPIVQNMSEEGENTTDITKINRHGLSDFGLKMVLGENMSSPNTIFNSSQSYATLVMGFPELEFSANEVYHWPKLAEDNVKPEPTTNRTDRGKNNVFLRESCQIISPISADKIPTAFKENNYGLSTPGNIMAYLQVVDLMAGKLRFIPVPEASTQGSVYASWYKQTYPDQVIAISPMSNEGLVSVDNAGTVRIWETGVANLSRSLGEWRRMVGELDHRDLMIKRDQVGDMDAPKHGQIDPTGAPHVGGNTWAGGTGGRDTAGLGGIGGPYRLDAGHNVHQLSDEVKQQVPEHIRKAAREMNRKAYAERLREIKMSEFDAHLYEQYSVQVRKQVQSLKNIINSLQAKAKDRQWLKNQTEGELDDTRLIEGITGEKNIYKRRGEQDPEPGSVQEKPKRLRLVVDVSGSMYRFNGHDQRLERMMESTLMVMEALEGYGDRIVYDIVGHSGEESDLPFTKPKLPPNNEKERLDVLKSMHAHAQFCMSGDHTLSATVLAIQELATKAEEYDESFVIVLSDANFDRYGISPKNFGTILNRRSDEVNAYALFIGSLGDQADQLAKRLPAGKAFVCLDTKRIPEVLKTIFTSTMLK